MRKVVIILIFLVQYLPIYSQDYTIENIVENIRENLEEDADITEIELYLFECSKKKLNLNEIGYDDLWRLSLLTPFQIESILSHRKAFGNFIDIHELLSVKDLSLLDIRNLLAFVEVKEIESFPKISLREEIRRANQEILFRTRSNLENKTDNYLGNNLYSLFRYRLKGKRIDFGIVAEKGAGEPISFTYNNLGVDFISGYLSYKPNPSTHYIVGDSRVGFGQGLALGNYFTLNFSPNALQMHRTSQVLMPSRSANEYSYFRGLAFEKRITNKLNFTSLVSYKGIDGSIDTLGRVSSVQESGYHRTTKELASKNAINQLVAATSFLYHHKTLKIGILGSYIHHNKEFKFLDRLQNISKSIPKSFIRNSLFYSYQFRNFFLEGETAIDNDANTAHIHQILYQAGSATHFGILYRNYSTSYIGMLSNAIAQNSSTSNEKGVYLSLSHQLNKKIHLSGYVDLSSFRSFRYSVYSPSNGIENRINLAITPRKTEEILVQYRFNQIQRNEITNTTEYQVNNQNTNRVRFSYKRQFNPIFVWQIRAEFVFDSLRLRDYETSDAVATDFKFKIEQTNSQLNLRLSYVDIVDYNHRVYFYEGAVPLAAGFPLLYGKGTRFSLIVVQKIKTKIEFSFQWINQEMIRNSELNQSNTITMQVRYKL